MTNSPKISLELLDNGRLAVKLPYNENFLSAVRALTDRRWNREERQWEVGIAHLQDLLDILQLDTTAVSRKALRAYQMYKIRHGRARIKADNIHAVLSGLNLPFEKIDKMTSYHVPGYRYMTRFKKGSWDGKRHLFHAGNHRFPSGLVRRVARILQSVDIDCDVRWPDEPEKQSLAGSTKSATATSRKKLRSKLTPLRDYQKECLSAALQERRGIIEIATGGGKTIIAAHLIHEISRPALFLVHTRDLLYQTIEVFERELKVPIGCVGDGRVEIQPVTVATVQTCARALDIKIEATADSLRLTREKAPTVTDAERIRNMVQSVPVAIFDECHHLPAETSYGLASEMTSALWRFGLSATPYRADRLDLLMEAALGPKIFSARASALIEMGFLVPPKIRFVRVPALIVKGKKVDYSEIYSTYIVENRKRNKLIVEAAREQVAEGKSVLVLVTQVRHGEILQGILKGAPLLQGNDPPELRREIFQALEKKSQPVAIATTLADEGLDLPSLNCVILAGAGRSETRALQRIGRALRTAPGKDHAVVIDFMDDAPYLREHASDRLEIYKTEPRFLLES